MPSLVEKILQSKQLGQDETGVLELDVDYFVTPEVSIPLYVRQLAKDGIESLAAAPRTLVVIDHEVFTRNVMASERLNLVRDICQKYGFTLFDIGRSGISHQLMPELGYVMPGGLIVASDTHASTFGAFGCLAFPVGFEFATALVANCYWTERPEVLRVNLVGKLRPGIMSRDIATYLSAHFADSLIDRVVEFGGEGWFNLTIDERMTLCNVLVEVRALTAIGPADERALEYLAPRVSGRTLEPITADADATYAQTVTVDLDDIPLLIVLPGNLSNVVPLDEALDVPISQAFIGSCASGRMEDFEIAGRLLRGKKIPSGVRLIITPSSPEIERLLISTGLYGDFTAAGAMVTPPTCGACYGSIAALGSKDVCIATATRNDSGRMGSRDAKIYLANAAVVAASAVAGRIARPASVAASNGERP